MVGGGACLVRTRLSGPQSLIRRENTGNSAGFEGIASLLGIGKRQVSGYFGKISLGQEQGMAAPGIRELGADNREAARIPASTRDDLKFFLRAIGGIDYVHEPVLAAIQEMLDAFKKARAALSDQLSAIVVDAIASLPGQALAQSESLLGSLCMSSKQLGPEMLLAKRRFSFVS